MLNFYRRFLPGIAHILKPLTDATAGSGKLIWMSEMQFSFDQAKALLASAVPLHHPHPSTTLSLATDASYSHVGAVMQQFTNGCRQPLAFFSHKLSPTESRYSISFDRELLAVFQAVKHFRHFRFFLEGRPFTLFTDHTPILAAISKNKTPFSSRQQRHLLFLPSLLLILYISLEKRILLQTHSYLDMAKAQSTCPSIPPLLQQSSLNITSVLLPENLRTCFEPSV
jgi:hypothetical protein